jgi:hypothetical protein
MADPSDSTDLDLRAEIARIDRDRAETSKLVAESRALLAAETRDGADTRKLLAEQAKLMAEQMKLQREWRLAPWLAWLGITGGVVTLTGAVLHALGRL